MVLSWKPENEFHIFHIESVPPTLISLFMTVKAYANTTIMQKHSPLRSWGFMLIFSISRVWRCVKGCMFPCWGATPPASTSAAKRDKGMCSHGEVTTLRQGQLPLVGALHRTRDPVQAAKAERGWSEEPPGAAAWLEKCKANRQNQIKTGPVEVWSLKPS